MWPLKRKKAKYIKINGIKCINDLVTEDDVIKFDTNNESAEVYVEDYSALNFYSEYYISDWGVDEEDIICAKREVLHFSPEGAAQAAKARFHINHWKE